MKHTLNILLLILTLVSCKNQSKSELNKVELKKEIAQIEKEELKEVNKLKTIPNDLRKLGAFDFFDSDEIMRIWRFPEGGAVFEELIEIKRNGKEWSSIRYTYLLDEYIDKPEYQKFRKKQTLKLKKEQILEFINKKLLQENIKPTKEDQICLCDIYLAEYRLNNEQNYFEFFLREEGNKNISKVNLMKFLNEIISE
ncbi:hypothetical protein H9W90_10430 [Polaribacter pectinis]|uniref:Lipoprotein n=1 Tax=Polaribacter pectinis TaxID=2738844 RepID=A0A7G9L7L3_9FLAO|nr:hypothetical protein [Polaribacter pectinis]QNM84612.1 hypothetical protein H9W90_10430 [Polaribacter pectinis]